MNEMTFLYQMIGKSKFILVVLILIQLMDIYINIQLPNLISKFIDQAVSSTEVIILVKLTIFGIILYSFSHICSFLTEFIFAKFSMKINYFIKSKLVDSFYYTEGEKLNFGKHKFLSLFVNDCTLIDGFITKGLSNLVASSIYLITILGVLSYKSFKLTVVLIINLMLISFFQKFINKNISKTSNIMINAFDHTISKIKNITSHIDKVVILDTNRYIKNNYLDTELNYLRKRKDLNIIFSIATILPSLIISIGSIVIISLGSFLMNFNALSIGTLSIFIFYSNRLVSPINDIVNLFSGWNQAKISIRRCIDAINQE